MFSLDEMVAAFDVEDVNPNPARFDQKKAESINGDHIRLLAPEDFAGRLVPYLADAGIVEAQPSADQSALIARLGPLVQERMQLLGEAPGMLGSFFRTASELSYDDDAVSALPATAGEVLAASVNALELVPDSEWAAAGIQDALQTQLIDGLGLKPRVAYGPVRVATSGRRVSPPLFESLQILGKQETLARLDRFSSVLENART